MDDLTDLIFINPEDIPDYITGIAEPCVGKCELVIRCGEIDVCRYEEGKLASIACDHPSHGCHPRFRERYAAVHELMAKLKGGRPDGPCPKCEDTGWLATNSPAARHTVLLSTMMGMWRGVVFKPRPLNQKDLGAMMATFLPGKPEGASSSPTGVAASGRAPLHSDVVNSEGEGEGKGKEQGEENV